MDGVQRAYDTLINRVFEYAFNDLVDEMIKQGETERRISRADSEKIKDFWRRELEKNNKEVRKLAEWFIIVIPRWRDLDGANFVKWAKEEADEYFLTGIRRNKRTISPDDLY